MIYIYISFPIWNVKRVTSNGGQLLGPSMSSWGPLVYQQRSNLALVAARHLDRSKKNTCLWIGWYILVSKHIKTLESQPQSHVRLQPHFSKALYPNRSPRKSLPVNSVSMGEDAFWVANASSIAIRSLVRDTVSALVPSLKLWCLLQAQNQWSSHASRVDVETLSWY